ncbi:DUF5305 domain-containing protein [Syntrophothermus lipocalidus]|uniref:DUF5305 domain-containing protein n=1 Tax=Syntrophothermus lipocalidus (strain DSM 12680 / TGB-C1) TaxID=643648 RepID=D7CMU2_SYNLT|nr:DUF5305 domain-containing protein [Syntrophothermus lipocalidus]ADI02027.1 hypothetical protein Slip_1255 [Syntrophothermus lipocalidus DSM 12680]
MRINKIEIESKMRRVIIFTLSLLVVGAGVYCIFAWNRPDHVVEPRPVYSYSQEGKLSYNVILKANSVFPTTVMGPGKTYFAKLVQSIPVVYSYRFTGDKPASMEATYSMVAVVDAPKMWSKEFVLIPPTKVQAEGKELSFVKTIDLNLDTYNQFLKSVNQELGVSAREPRLVLKGEVLMKAVSSEGIINGSVNPRMVIPLTSGDFQISGSLTDSKPGTLKIKERVIDQGALVARKISVIALGFLVLVLLGTVLLTSSRIKPVDEVTRSVQMIIKKFSDRLIKREDVLVLPQGVTEIALSSVKELEAVADEISKPVIFGFDYKGVYVFCLIDGRVAYTYRVVASEKAVPHQLSEPLKKQVPNTVLSGKTTSWKEGTL